METGKIIYLKQLQTLFDSIPEAVYVTDLETNELLYINKFLINLLNIGPKSYKGKKCYKILQGLDEPCKFCTNKNLTETAISWTHMGCITKRWYRCIDKKIYIGPKAIPARLEIAVDITNEVSGRQTLLEREQELEKKLEEKQVLIKEIHHRVKNNNQLLISLLHLQSMKTRSKVGRQDLIKAMNRVKAISLTYEKLYLHKDLSEIHLSKYFKEIITGLSITLLKPYNINIETKIDKDIIIKNINQITPIGLIISELLSNCSKYAFKETQKNKKIKINLTNNDNIITLTVEDNGEGLPKNYNIKKQTTMGTILVQTLTLQLGGKIIYESSPGHGVKITLKFKIK